MQQQANMTGTFKKVLVAIDGSRPAARALDVAIKLASQIGAQLATVHVVDLSRAFVPELGIADDVMITTLRREGAESLDAACRRVPESLKVERFLVEGEPAETIISTAEDWGADVIVMGSDSRGRLAHFLLGSTADSVIRRSPCPVMTVRVNAATATDVSGQKAAART
jgi:nucleotide-binding universal stress UspA family protein